MDTHLHMIHMARTVKPQTVTFLDHNKKIQKNIKNHQQDIIIKQYQIFLNDDEQIVKLKLTGNAQHPNADPKTGEFCIPFEFQLMEYGMEGIEVLEKLMKNFNLMSCYHELNSSYTIEGGRRANDY